MGNFNFKSISEEKIVQMSKSGGTGSSDNATKVNNYTASATPLTTEKNDIVGMINENHSTLTDITNNLQIKGFVILTQAQYDALSTKDSKIVYLISG